MSNIYLKVTMRKAVILKISIFQVKKFGLWSSFWEVPSHVDITEF